jgi:hypothetical protein
MSGCRRLARNDLVGSHASVNSDSASRPTMTGRVEIAAAAHRGHHACHRTLYLPAPMPLAFDFRRDE